MAEGIPAYDELKLRVERVTNGSYRVLALGPSGSAADGTFAVPFSDTELENFVLRIGSARRNRVRAYRSSQMEVAREFGSRLFDTLVQGEVRDVYHAARHVAEAHDRGLRVTLYFTGVPELMEIPWEFLYERPSFLSQSIYTPLVRSLDLTSARPPRKVTLPLQILGMASSPEGYDTLDTSEEKRKLGQALRAAIGSGLVQLRWLDRATLSELERTMGAPDEIHVLHYIGHGAYDSVRETGVLILENERGGPQEVTGEELGTLLYDKRSLRLAVLNSCEGARSSRADPFSGTAASLVEHGLPAVIGMQFEITDDAAITFAERLYGALGHGYPVDAALAHARKAIFAAGGDVEFGTPVLFLRSADARLFDVDAVPARRVTQAQGDFSVQLDHTPPDARPGDKVTWRLTIQNGDAGALEDVTVTQADGEPLAESVELAAGCRHVIRWTETLEPDISRLLTVTACDERGSRVSEQITARVTGAPPANRRRLRLLIAAAAALIVIVGVALVLLADGGDGVIPADNLTDNPSFERDTSGWFGWRSNVARERASDAPDGEQVARVSLDPKDATHDGYSIDDTPQSVESAVAGRSYTATAWVKATEPNDGETIFIVLRLHPDEDSSAVPIEAGESASASADEYTEVQVTYEAETDGRIGVYVAREPPRVRDREPPRVQEAESFFVDAISITEG